MADDLVDDKDWRRERNRLWRDIKRTQRLRGRAYLQETVFEPGDLVVHPRHGPCIIRSRMNDEGLFQIKIKSNRRKTWAKLDDLRLIPRPY